MIENWDKISDDFSQRVENVSKLFNEKFGSDPNLTTNSPKIVYSPGRAEVIGNHTDYNKGFTLSVNISCSNILVAIAPRKDKKVRLYSEFQKDKIVEFDISNAEIVKNNKYPIEQMEFWANYVQSVSWVLLNEGFEFNGFDAVIESTIPIGAGVSSSAALEASIAHYINYINTFNISKEKLVEMCKFAENKYVGAPCGFLDQATNILSNNSFLKIQYQEANGVPFTWEEIKIKVPNKYKFVIGYDKESKHALVSGKYAERQNGCFASIPLFQELIGRKDILSLSDISSTEFERFKSEFKIKAENLVPTVEGRVICDYAEHVIYENERVLNSINALQNESFEEFGDLLTKSGASAIYKYNLADEAPELIWIYETILENQNNWGVLGIRNMGGGFNASTLALILSDNLVEYKTKLNGLYKLKFARELNFLEFDIAPASGILNINK
jgi:galactokinase